MADEQRPTTPVKQADMARGERIQVQVYCSLGWTYQQIAGRMQKTLRQIQIACTSPATPQKKPGRRPEVTAEMRQQLVQFVCASQQNRLMPYKAISKALGWNVSEG
jgi:hypothetical protein